MAVLAFMFQDYVREWGNDLFLQNVKAYREDIDLQNLIDSLQRVVRNTDFSGKATFVVLLVYVHGLHDAVYLTGCVF